MADVAAARLNLRAPAGWTARAQARVEDALRSAAGDDGRLMVLRRLDLGRVPLGAPPLRWTAHAEARVRALTAHAVHGGAAGADHADAVWFASAAEAQALLLAELAAGRTQFAWFWRLALPGWRGANLAAWLPVLVAEAELSAERLADLARAVVRIAAAGQLPALVAALPAAMRTHSVRDWRAAPEPLKSGTKPGTSAAASLDERQAALAVAAFERLPAAVRQAFIAMWRALPAASPAARWLARLAAIAAAAEIASQPALLDVAARVLPARARRDEAADPAPGRSTAPPPAGAAATPPASDVRDRPTAATPPPVAELTAAPGQRSQNGSTSDSDKLPALQPESVPDAARASEQLSAAAGLWLLIRPLHAMGLGEWLAARPEQATEGFARALLHSIAERQRVAETDPLFAILGEARGAPDPAQLGAWRIGLDRWLRRRTRRNLAVIVKRRGWLRCEEAGVTVRFRVDQADIGLRRRALDVDPGWVPWLGLTVRYHFRDEAQQ